jgi:hypothetical protein
MWEKIVLNLLSNALKFTFSGSIRVALCRRDDAIELSVVDTGTGIPETELRRLFERFHRVEGARSRTHEGTGIGLALTHELVRLHGGTIAVESEVDKGSRFVVRVPLGREHLPHDRVLTTSSPTSSTRSAGAFVDEAARWPAEPIDDTASSIPPIRAEERRTADRAQNERVRPGPRRITMGVGACVKSARRCCFCSSASRLARDRFRSDATRALSSRALNGLTM